ncbi:spermatogenesis-associated protein 7 homolog isoform X2 [Tubulanus polymorphus]
MPVQREPVTTKGHLGLKSSPYAPTATKLSGQHIIQDHMTAHYRMINSAKPAVDTSTPKAWLISQKVRDRARREALKQNVLKPRSRPPSRSSSRHSNTSQDGYLDDDDPYSPYHRAMRGPMKANHDIRVDMVQETEMPFVEKMVNDTKNSPIVYQSPRPIRSNIPDYVKSGSGNPPPGSPRRTSAGDLLNDHSDSFTEGRPFTPRTLKTNRRSKLSEFRYYNPPPQKKNGKSSEKQPKNSGTNGRVHQDESENLMFETLQSRDFSRVDSARKSDVPKLDITVDQDHMKWLHEQATKAQYRTSRDSRFNESMPNTRNKSGFYSGRMETRELGTIQTARSMDREEELKYLDFVRDVTSDVLERGIFTNRVLKQVFEHHLEKHKDKGLKLNRMRELLNKLRQDLGIPANDEDDDEHFGYKSTISMSDSLNHHDFSSSSSWKRRQDVSYSQLDAKNDNKFETSSKRVSNNIDIDDNKYNSSDLHKTVEIDTKEVHLPPTPKQRTVRVTDSVEIKSATEESEPVFSDHEQSSEIDVASRMRQLTLEDNVTGDTIDGGDEGQSESTEISTDRLPTDQKWMRDNKSFTMTLKPGQLDMTLVKPKPRERRRKRSQDSTGQINGANKQTPSTKRGNEGNNHNDELGSTLTDITPMEEAANNDKSEASTSKNKPYSTTADLSGDDDF